MNQQRGQSLLEFAVGSAALLLLLLGTITLSVFQEAQRRGVSAARQVAFESTWLPADISGGVLVERVYEHHFDDEGLMDAVGRARHLGAADLRLSRELGATPGLAGDAANLLLTSLKVSSALVGGDIDLAAGGYASGDLSVHLPPRQWIPEPFRGLDLTLLQPFAIATDAWSASGPHKVKQRTESLVPLQRLSSIATLWQDLAKPLTLLEPSIDKLCLGLIEPDEVPQDRLGPVMDGTRFRRSCQ